MSQRPDSRATNFLAGPYIDRRAMQREEAQWYESALGDPATRFLVARGTTQLVQVEPRPTIAFLSGDHPLVQGAPRDALLLLGWFQDARCVLLLLDDEPAVAPPAGTRFEELRPLAPLFDAEEAGLLAYARALGFWRARHRYCGCCGAPARPQRAGHALRCENPHCAVEIFPRIDPAIIVLVSDGERALLGRQAGWPEGRYSTIAGFVEPGESLEDAVAREVLEETGVRVTDVQYHSSQPWPFPSSLMLGFIAGALPGSIARGDAELEDARWFTRDEIASGTPLLPTRTSISWKLIEHWFDSGSAVPLAAQPAVGQWNARRA
jgi:NAD+ diphosphatase